MTGSRTGAVWVEMGCSSTGAGLLLGGIMSLNPLVGGARGQGSDPRACGPEKFKSGWDASMPACGLAS